MGSRYGKQEKIKPSNHLINVRTNIKEWVTPEMNRKEIRDGMKARAARMQYLTRDVVHGEKMTGEARREFDQINDEHKKLEVQLANLDVNKRLAGPKAKRGKSYGNWSGAGIGGCPGLVFGEHDEGGEETEAMLGGSG